MGLFTLKRIKEINGVIEFFKLYRNGRCKLDEFEREVSKDKIFAKEFIKIQVIMQEIADMKRLPEKKFKNITPKKEKVKEYEIKTENLRVYCFHAEKLGRIVVTGGMKSKKQQRDINGFRGIKMEYLDEVSKDIQIIIK